MVKQKVLACGLSLNLFSCIKIITIGQGSIVGIATGYGLVGPGIESRWGARFSAHFQTGSGAHPAPCTMGTGSFLGRVKSGRSVTLTPHPTFCAVGHERVELYLYSPYGPYGLYGASVPVQEYTLPLPYSRATPLFPLWAVRSVQSLSACTRVHFTFTLQ
jgi:hypothetical protein